jgi:hypothetical protein
MRSQFISVLQDFCRRRSRESSTIRWWFSDRPIQAKKPYRVGAEGFGDEQTIPGRDPDVETLEDPPLEDEFFHSIGFA